MVETNNYNLEKGETYLGNNFIDLYKRQVLSSLSEGQLDDIIKNKTIIIDLYIRKYLYSGNWKTEISFSPIQGLPEGLKIQNPDVLIQFCKIHGFFPIIQNIYLDKIDISKIKEIPQLLNLFIWMIKNGDIHYALYSEISKIIDILEGNGLNNYDIADFYYIMSVFDNIRTVGTRDIPQSFGSGLQKNRNQGTFSENIFCEIAFRLENELRKALGIYSTYLKLASMREDNERKTDMNITVNKGENDLDSYKTYPVQFTISNIEENKKLNRQYNVNKKILGIEKWLFTEMFKTKTKITPFIVLSVNGDFAKKLSKGEFQEQYDKRISNKEFRESQSDSKFPFFINILKQEDLVGAKVGYVVLNIFISKIDLEDQNLMSEDIEHKIKEILENMEGKKIGWIFLDKISIKISEKKTIKSPNPKQKINLTFYDIEYSYKEKKYGNMKIYI
ncbi:hypothetical protein [Candidatus Vampirococcus lugosii]|uniref:Uncharacterized protein n=1 Tax=Candidatus Vampirococcus lugosii TaxID=2789015 RepID=A0ABS5QMA7_9BACT|nr:hypothetical protein [Candidatus Vampirococcus lugosii]MBS8122323.1 hypothetical protein [Candidatus Vampirococcus lugosii]